MATPGPVNEQELAQAVLAYQESGSERDAETVLRLADPPIAGMVVRSATAFHFNFKDATNRVRLKIFKALRSYNPNAGPVFSYFNCVVQNHVRSLTTETIREKSRCVYLEDLAEQEGRDTLLEIAADPWRTEWLMEDIRDRLYSLRTICTRENELHAQRWLVRSLIATEFSLPRHEAVRALRIAFDVDLKAGRLIHDQTVLELRRTMLAGRRDRDYPAINIAMLKDKRERGLLKFKSFLSDPDFSKLCFLMRGLAPVIIGDLIERDIRSLNGTRSQETEREVITKQLHYALHGYPRSRPLFGE